MTTELELCPFCGSNEANEGQHDGNSPVTTWAKHIPMPLEWWVECPDCMCHGPSAASPEEAEDAWNKRRGA